LRADRLLPSQKVAAQISLSLLLLLLVSSWAFKQKIRPPMHGAHAAL
jgi:hypothetical protein